jgi:RNA polymerase sigma factor (sigma-70 family)
MGGAASIEGLLPVVRAMAARLSRATNHRVPAEDLSQVGLIAVHTVLLQPGTLAEDRIRARASAAARNAMIDLARVETRCRHGTRLAAATVPLQDRHDQEPDPRPGPEEIAIRRQMARLVAEAIQALPRRLQDVLRLSYEGDVTRAELAAMWGLEPARISQLHAEAIAELRSMLAPELPPPAARPPSEGDMFHPDIVKGATPAIFRK